MEGEKGGRRKEGGSDEGEDEKASAHTDQVP